MRNGGARGRRRAAVVALVAIVGLAVAGWLAARNIRSPATIAAETAATAPSPIAVPVARRTLSTEVIVRGTVRYGAPQDVVRAQYEARCRRDNQALFREVKPVR